MADQGRRTNRWGRRARKLGLTLFVAAFALYLARSWTVFPALGAIAERYVEARFDADVSVQGLGGDGWRTLTAERIRLVAHPDSPSRLRTFTASEIEVRLSLVALLLGRSGWLEALHVTDAEAHMDVTRPGSGAGENEGETVPRIGTVPDVRVDAIRLRTDLGEDRYAKVLAGSVRCTAAPGGTLLEVAGVDIELSLLPSAEPYTAVLSVSGLLQEERVTVRTARLDGPELTAVLRAGEAAYADLTLASGLSGLRAELDLEISGLLARLGADRLPATSRITARGVVRDERLVLDAAELAVPGGIVRLSQAEFIPGPEGMAWNTALEVEVERLEDLQGLLGAEGWSGGMSAQATAQGTGSLTQLAVEIDAHELELADQRVGTGHAIGDVILDLRVPRSVTGSVSVDAGPAWVAGRRFETIDGAVTLNEDHVIIDDCRAVQPGNLLRTARLRLPRTLDPARLLDGARGSVEVHVTDAASLLGDLAPKGIDELPAHELRFGAGVADGVAAIDEGRLVLAGGGLTVRRGLLQLARRRSAVTVELDLDLALDDLSTVGDLVGEPLEGTLAGALTIGGTLEALRATYALTGAGVRVRGESFDELTLEGTAHLRGVDVESLKVVHAFGAAEVAGACDRGDDGWAGTLRSLVLSSDTARLALKSPCAFALGPDRAELEALTLEGSVGELDLAARRDGNAWSVRAAAVAFDLDAVLPERGLGYADGELTVDAVDGEVSGTLTAGLRGWSAPGLGPLDTAELDLGLANELLRIRQLTVQARDGAAIDLSGAVPFDPLGEALLPEGELALRGTIGGVRLATLDPEARLGAALDEASADVTLDLAGTWRAPEGDLHITAGPLTLVDRPTGTLEASLVLHRTSIEGRVVGRDPERVNLEASGLLEAPLDLTQLRVDHASLLDAPFRAEVAVASGDLSWLASAFDGVRRSAGRVDSKLVVTGSLTEPRVEGSLLLRDGEVRLESDLPALSFVSGDLRLEEGRLVVETLTGELGGAPVAISGSASMRRDDPLALALAFTGDNLLLHRDVDALVRADAALTLEGPLSAPVLRGDVNLRQSWLTRRVRLIDFQSDGLAPLERGLPLASFPEPPLSLLVLDLNVTAAEPVILRNNIARGGLRPALRVTGTGLAPRLEGAVLLDPTTLALPGATLEFRAGSFAFNPRNPFVPELQLVGTAKKFGHDITVVVTGPYDDPEVELSATPPLSHEDIVLILLTGRPPLAYSEGGARLATQNVALYFAQDFATAWFDSDGAPSESWLDRVEIVSGEEISRNGVPTLEIHLRIANDALNRGGRVDVTTYQDVFEDTALGIRWGFRLR